MYLNSPKSVNKNLEKMKKIFIIICIPLLVSCTQKPSIDTAKDEIFQTEKEFEKMVSDKGLAEAFYYFADEP